MARAVLSFNIIHPLLFQCALRDFPFVYNNHSASFENRFRRVPGAARIGQGGLRDTPRHATVIIAHFCDLKVLSANVVLAILGLN